MVICIGITACWAREPLAMFTEVLISFNEGKRKIDGSLIAVKVINDTTIRT